MTWEALWPGLVTLVIYYGVSIVLALLIRAFVHSRGVRTGERYRKLLHMIQVCSILPLTLAFPGWVEPVVVEVVLCAAVYLALLVIDRLWPGLFGDIIRERHKNEGRVSLCLSFGTMALLIAVVWGLWGERWLVTAGVLAWGCSDMAAALVGRRFGRHHPESALFDTNKTWEGAAANAVVAFLVSFAALLAAGGRGAGACAVMAFTAALVSAAVELMTRGGFDTVTVPLSVTAALVGAARLLGLFPTEAEGVFAILVCFFAGVGAGLGTGLCGLSAAAVIVPMLFSFLDVPAYQATGVALGADVLASASSAIIYARHKNINLRYGTIMLASISLMTIVGSLAAHKVGNFTLGSISIIVTACLGIKFLWKPVKSHSFAPEGKEERKKIIQSLLCGLGIGGLCGFVGTGGGTLMLIVLTSVIGFDLKMAVGTSVYIMTATAFIGATTHFVVAGAPDMTITVLTVAFTLVWAQVGAIFANKVSPALMNRVCGAVLLILGVAMMIMKWLL